MEAVQAMQSRGSDSHRFECNKPGKQRAKGRRTRAAAPDRIDFFMAIDWFPFWLTLRVAAIATAAAVGAGLWLGWLLAKPPFRGQAILDAAVSLPLVLPPTVLGYYLLVLIGQRSPLGRLYEWITGHPLVFTWQIGRAHV